MNTFVKFAIGASVLSAITQSGNPVVFAATTVLGCVYASKVIGTKPTAYIAGGYLTLFTLSRTHPGVAAAITNSTANFLNSGYQTACILLNGASYIVYPVASVLSSITFPIAGSVLNNVIANPFGSLLPIGMFYFNMKSAYSLYRNYLDARNIVDHVGTIPANKNFNLQNPSDVRNFVLSQTVKQLETSKPQEFNTFKTTSLLSLFNGGFNSSLTKNALSLCAVNLTPLLGIYLPMNTFYMVCLATSFAASRYFEYTLQEESKFKIAKDLVEVGRNSGSICQKLVQATQDPNNQAAFQNQPVLANTTPANILYADPASPTKLLQNPLMDIINVKNNLLAR
jgi:hypothetical protein